MSAKDQKKEAKDWADMSDDEEDGKLNATKEEKKVEKKAEEEKPVEKKYIPPTKKGTKNKRGDYVVTSINVVDTRTGIKDKEQEAE